MPRTHGVPAWWNDRYHALLDQFVEHMEREFAGITPPTNRDGYCEGYLEYEGLIDQHDQFWNIPMPPLALDYKDDRWVVIEYGLSGRGLQFYLPGYMRAALDPDYQLQPDTDGFLEHLGWAEVKESLTLGQKRVVRQFLEMVRLQGNENIDDAIANYWHQFPPFFETIEPEY